jgi:hypothetical protein
MNAMEVVARAKERCAELQAASPDFSPLRSIAEQLSYIETAILDKAADRSRLNDGNIGLFAAREFEARAPDFAELLYAVEDVVSDLKKSRL